MKIKNELLYKFGRKYKYCFDCLKNYKLTKTESRYLRCGKCSDKFRSGGQG